jgi:hypothetical protein
MKEEKSVHKYYWKLEGLDDLDDLGVNWKIISE